MADHGVLLVCCTLSRSLFNKHHQPIVYSKLLFDHHLLRHEVLAHIFIHVPPFSVSAFSARVSLQLLQLFIVRVRNNLFSTHTRRARLNRRLRQIHAELIRAEVIHRPAAAESRREQRRHVALIERRPLAHRHVRRRRCEVALQEEIEEVHDGDEAAGLARVVDTHQRRRVSLREGEEEVRERLVGVDHQLRAEWLELRERATVKRRLR